MMKMDTERLKALPMVTDANMEGGRNANPNNGAPWTLMQP